MARTKTISSIDSEIGKTKDALAKAKVRYDVLADKLEALFDERREFQGRVIMDSFIKSGKSFDEMMNFLNAGGKN
jgi:hypothetical protein